MPPTPDQTSRFIARATKRVGSKPAHQRIFLSMEDIDRLCPTCGGCGCCVCYQTGWKDAPKPVAREEVEAFARRASKIVDGWPQWKRDALITALGGHP